MSQESVIGEPLLEGGTSPNVVVVTQGYWDIKTADKGRPTVRVEPGRWALPGRVLRCRQAGTVEWKPLSRGSRSDDQANAPIPPQVASDPPIMSSDLVDTWHFKGDEATLRAAPPHQKIYEFQVLLENGTPLERLTATPTFRLPPELMLGDHRARCRYLSGATGWWSPWSRPLPVHVRDRSQAHDVERHRVREHQLNMMLVFDRRGVANLETLDVEPPDCDPNTAHWFMTPQYDGASMPMNEDPEYYRAPLDYYLNAIDVLIDRQARFVTWHDVLEGDVGRTDLEVLIQFDMDGGPWSMQRVYEQLATRAVRATVMVHREANDWYEYCLEDLDLAWLREAEQAGWAVGYHNNSLGNEQRLDRLGDYGEGVLRSATHRFSDDVSHLRKLFDIRTFTHHGGIVENYRTPLPADAPTAVDRSLSPWMWRPFTSRFSDGGFLARPRTLKEQVERATQGLHFFRNHPVKYANFVPPFDLPPLHPDHARRVGVEPDDALRQASAAMSERSLRWLELRDSHRLQEPMRYVTRDKPLSKRFAPWQEVEERVLAHRTRRKANLLRRYPWPQGDPRVFWWRLLDASVPSAGRVLNVGALPVEHRMENIDFLPRGTQVVEMDIDPSREPDILGDITQLAAAHDSQYDAVLLFGLGCIHTPSAAVEACHRALRPGGVALFGFNADTDPFRGARWQPDRKPRWSREAEPWEGVNIRGGQFSFDDKDVRGLFDVFTDVRIEAFLHTWFVAARRAA